MSTLRFSADADIKTSLLLMYERIAQSPTNSVTLESIGASASGLLMKLISKIKYPITSFHSETCKLKESDNHFTLRVSATVSAHGELCAPFVSNVTSSSNAIMVYHTSEVHLSQQVSRLNLSLESAGSTSILAFGKQIGLALILLHRCIQNRTFKLCLQENAKGTQILVVFDAISNDDDKK